VGNQPLREDQEVGQVQRLIAHAGDLQQQIRASQQGSAAPYPGWHLEPEGRRAPGPERCLQGPDPGDQFALIQSAAGLALPLANGASGAGAPISADSARALPAWSSRGFGGERRYSGLNRRAARTPNTCITTRKHSKPLQGPQPHSIRPAQAPDQGFRFALTRRRSCQRVDEALTRQRPRNESGAAGQNVVKEPTALKGIRRRCLHMQNAV
jgi:hypothetical protein